MIRVAIAVVFGVGVVACVSGQRGDHKGKEQPPLPATLRVPPAPVLSPAEALKSLRVQPGFEVSLVAAEPLVVDPVCVSFDEDGRLWVVEMRGFMPDVDGTNELAPVGRVVTLIDEDGNGVMDVSRVFLDGLVLPRLVSIVNEGVLVLEPPKLYLCRDTDGDGRCDQKTVIRDGLGGRRGPEHAINGGMIGLDNWIQFAKFGERLRRVGGVWTWRPQLFRGQWGISQDDFGRNYHNGNSDYLRGDPVPAHYFVRNRNYGNVPGANVQIARDQSTWPIRITPGINRGYQKNMLRDFKLARFTAACSPVIYRDDVFPADCLGDAFVCEPSGNFVRRADVTDGERGLTGRNAYEKDEFLASTDERFRPVDLKIGPDGGLYVVDLYRGILQHKVYVTTFLRKQILERGLDKPVGLGRIYRVMPRGAERREAPRLSKATDRELADALSHPSGFFRDTAQRLLIGRGARVASLVDAVARDAKDPRARLHALWTLEGLGALSDARLRAAVADAHHQVRCAAIRMLEPKLAADVELRGVVEKLVTDPDRRVAVQALLSLGASGEPGLAIFADAAMAPKFDRESRYAILSGAGGQELSLVRLLQSKTGDRTPTRESRSLIEDLARCVTRSRRGDEIAALLELASTKKQSAWCASVFRGVASVLDAEAKKKKRERVLSLGRSPKGLEPLARTEDAAARVLRRLAWPGRPMDTGSGRPRTRKDRRRIARGKQVYLARCMACHQLHGKGQDGLAPSLVGSSLVLGPLSRLIPIVTHGLTGPLVVDGEEWNLLMPAIPDLGDADVALILSYVRNSWGHEASLVETKDVKAQRARHAKRGAKPFTVEELMKIR